MRHRVLIRPSLAIIAVTTVISGRTRPGRVLGDKAYSGAAIRAHLRRRRIRATIPEPADQASNRLRRGSKGGRPPAFDTAAYE